MDENLHPLDAERATNIGFKRADRIRAEVIYDLENP